MAKIKVKECKSEKLFIKRENKYIDKYIDIEDVSKRKKIFRK